MASAEGGASSFPMSPEVAAKKPLVVLLVGMAGTGKSTLTHRLALASKEQGINSYFINLDPAAMGETSYGANIDIRDTVDYKKVMKEYRLGPNGAIMTSLNLYATKFHQVISILEKKEGLDYIFVDTPGQIEVFTWSASGQLITEAFASTFPTCTLFVGDNVRCSNPQTFMSMMLYASSVMYKSQLPLILVLNKIDVVAAEQVMSWIRDTDSLSEALKTTKGYAATLTSSLALFIHEFYENIPCVGVSAVEGTGIRELFGAAGLGSCKEEYVKSYLPLVGERVQRVQQAESARQVADTNRLRQDLREGVPPAASASNPVSSRPAPVHYDALDDVE
jgi:GTPase SAR1 family protein